MRQIENYFREGKQMKYTKFVNRDEVALSFPTEMATPFIYTLDMPTVLSFQAKTFRSSGQPEAVPMRMQTERGTVDVGSANMQGGGGIDLRAVYSTKIQGQLGFITPFDHQQYSCGYERSIQVYVPLRVKGTVDLQNKDVHCEFELLQLQSEQKNNIRMLQYSATPYITSYDILNVQPVISRPNTHIIYSKDQNTYDAKFGEKSTGMVFHVQYANEDNMYMDYRWLYEQVRHYNFYRAIAASLAGRGMKYKKIAIDYVGDLSLTKKVNIHLKYLDDDTSSYQHDESENYSSTDISQIYRASENYQKKCEQFAKKASSGIRSPNPWALFVKVDFGGRSKTKWEAILSHASSPIDQKSHTLAFLDKQCDSSSDCKPYQIAVSAKSSTPLTDEINLLSILNQDLSATTQIEAAFGEKQLDEGKIKANIRMRRSETRKQYLQRDPSYYKCKSQMEQGNYQLPACVYLTERAKYFDKIETSWLLENNNSPLPLLKNVTYKIYSLLRSVNPFNYDEDFVYSGSKGNSNGMYVDMSYHPEDATANVTLTHMTYRVNYKNAYVSDLVRPLVSANWPYSSYHYGRALGFDENKREYNSESEKVASLIRRYVL